MAKERFVNWLQTQQDRQDEVGEIARGLASLKPEDASSLEAVLEPLFAAYSSYGSEFAEWIKSAQPAYDAYLAEAA